MAELEYTCILLGSNGVGKTSVINKFINGKMRPPKTEKRISFCNKYSKTVSIGKENPISLTILDPMYERQHVDNYKQYLGKVAGVILIYDVLDPESFRYMVEQLHRIMISRNRYLHVMIIANKSDMATSGSISNSGKVIAKQYRIEYVETSALENTNICYVFKKMAKSIYLNTFKVKAKLHGIKTINRVLDIDAEIDAYKKYNNTCWLCRCCRCCMDATQKLFIKKVAPDPIDIANPPHGMSNEDYWLL
jgi:GTPase SAR1 family protein